MSVHSYTKAKYDRSDEMGLPDFPSGPLDIYRKKASFNWKEMVMFLEGEDMLAFKVGFVMSIKGRPCQSLLFANRKLWAM